VPDGLLSTAHPSKFPDAVQKATRRAAALPPRLADLIERTERVDGLPNGCRALKGLIEDRHGGAAATFSCGKALGRT
jgi:threonine synthase